MISRNAVASVLDAYPYPPDAKEELLLAFDRVCEREDFLSIHATYDADVEAPFAPLLDAMKLVSEAVGIHEYTGALVLMLSLVPRLAIASAETSEFVMTRKLPSPLAILIIGWIALPIDTFGIGKLCKKSNGAKLSRHYSLCRLEIVLILARPYVFSIVIRNSEIFFRLQIALDKIRELLFCGFKTFFSVSYVDICKRGNSSVQLFAKEFFVGDKHK